MSNSNNRIIVFASILGAILATGILALNPSTITNAQAQMYENQYDTRYNDNRYGYDDNRYGYDDNRYGYDDNRYGYDNGYLEKNIKPKIFPANKVAELGDKWWQWILSLDVKTNPNPFTNTGQPGCDVGLQDNGKLFLVGTFKDVTTFPPTGFPVHECEIKKGTQILFPILNVFCSSLDNPPLETEAEQRLCANDAQDRGQDYYLEIDGFKVKNSNQLEEKYRIDSPAGGFTFIGVENSPYGIVGTGEAVSDGVWILLEGLKPGEHTIKFSGTFDWSDFPPPFNGIFEFGATYNLYVHPGYY